jgi:hypothetical protein
MVRRVASPKGAKAKADRLFSLIVRSRGACQACNKKANLQCAHIISRRFANTRCDERNALCLCGGCHHFFTDHPVEFGEFVTELIGSGTYGELYQLAHSLVKVDWVSVAGRLEDRWRQIEEAA